MISQRTKAALQAAKARGVKLGSPNSCANQKNRSDAFAETLRGAVWPMVQADVSSRQIADQLNAGGIKTSTGGEWSSRTVVRLLERLT